MSDQNDFGSWHSEHPDFPANRESRLLEALVAIRRSILNLDLRDAIGVIDHHLCGTTYDQYKGQDV